MGIAMNVLGHPVVEKLAWALLHFLWQGTLIFIAVWVILAATRRLTAHARYLILCSSMSAMAACPVITLAWIWPADLSTNRELTPAPVKHAVAPVEVDVSVPDEAIVHESADLAPQVVGEVPSPVASTSVDRATLPFRMQWHQAFERIVRLFPAFWFTGVCILSFRLLIAWQWICRLRRRSTRCVSVAILETFDHLVRRLQIKRSVILVESALVDVPTIIGWLKPVVLLPAAALAGLEPNQLESLLAHELAHIRRHDYLVNLVQTMIETLLYYHPAVWWLSRRIRTEREDCCDDLAITVCGDRLTYARALATMEERRSSPGWMLAANGNSLKARIQRILSVPREGSVTNRGSLVPSAAAVVSLVGLYAATMLVIAAPWHTADGKPPRNKTTSDDSFALAVADSAAEKGQSDDDWKSLLAELRKQEARYQTYSAKMRTTREFGSPKNSTGAVAGFRVDGPTLVSITSISQQAIDGQNFRFIGEDIVKRSVGEPVGRKRQAVFDGQQTVAIEEGSNTTVYESRAEPPQMLPPHCWGISHLSVSFPLSVYLEGTEAIRAHPKVGRHPQEAGSIFEFNRVESAIVGEDTIDGLDCTIVLVKRWHYSSGPPSHQYLWLAKDRNLHVLQTRTAHMKDGDELPQEESRVKRWRKIADGVWLPELVEVISISPDAVKNKTIENITYRMALESMEWNPKLSADEFKRSESAKGLPKFVVSADNRLIDSPLHPVPLSPHKSTTLDEILNRLADEEKKYDPCELSCHGSYQFLNPLEGMPGVISNTQSKQRSVIHGDHKYLEERQQSISQSGNSSSSQFQADDGKVRRSTYSSTNQGTTQHWGTIDLGRSKDGFRRFQAHELLSVPRGLAKLLKSGQYDESQGLSMTVEYIGDERIGDLTCHKLKCDLTHNHFFLWLARDRNLLPIRHEWYEPRWHASLPSGINMVQDLREIGPKVWFPQRAMELAFQKMSREGLVVSRIALQWRRDLTVERMTLQPAVEDRLFSELLVEKGTQVSVNDERSQSIGQYSTTARERLDITLEKLQELRDKTKKTNEPSPERIAEESPTGKLTPSRDRGDSVAGKLLDRLEQFNGSQAIFKDGWMRVMKQIVELGPDAVPDLIEELDATDNDRMLRCLGFMTRAIDDKRAVPALIRAIPKTLRKPGSDMGLTFVDPELMKFARQHEIDDGDKRWFGFHRPVREVCGALRKLTGQQFNEQAVFLVFLNGVPPQWRQSRQQYYAVAKHWADWWEQHWSEFVEDKEYAKVNLGPLTLASPPRRGTMVETIGEKTGLILQSVIDPASQQVFYDIDADRFAAVPEKWRESGDIASHLDRIIEWAQQEGFDLMGTEYPAQTPDDKPVFALRGIGLRSWEQDAVRWKQQRDVVTLEMLVKESNPITGFLLHRNREQASQVADPKSTASFLVTTSEGTPALLHVGVEVQNTKRKPGEFFVGVHELNPIGPMKGRRFSVMYLNELEQRP
jgi:beta-lactamase regulating signal transducer with metallopeptidase domain